MSAEGMKITLKPLTSGLTVNKFGKALLAQPFVFQCPPMNTFPITRAFTTNNYDTIENEQFSTLISRQLDTITFDTLVMELGVKERARQKGARGHGAAALGQAAAQIGAAVGPDVHSPSWVPFPSFNGGNIHSPVSPQWYVEQLDALVDSCAPFKFVAAYKNSAKAGVSQSAAQAGPIASFEAQLLSFQEVYNAGEGDAVYLSAVTFSQWKNAKQSEQALGTNGTSVKLPTNVVIGADGNGQLANPRMMFSQPSMTDLAKFFYHDASAWKAIAQENGITGIGQNDPLGNAPKYKGLSGTGTAKIKIPAYSAGTASSTGGSSLGLAASTF